MRANLQSPSSWAEGHNLPLGLPWAVGGVVLLVLVFLMVVSAALDGSEDPTPTDPGMPAPAPVVEGFDQG